MELMFIYLTLWRIAALVILVSLLQASPGHSWLFSSRRRRSPPRRSSPSACQTDWSQWSECTPFCGYNSKRTRFRDYACRKEIAERSCMPSCDQKCDETNKKCACYTGYTLDTRNGKSCIDMDECKQNGGRGPCSHTCRNFDGGYICSCNKGYTLVGRTKCVPRDCRRPQFSSCPSQEKSQNKHKYDGNLPVCKTIVFACKNGTTYNSQCTLRCPVDYTLAVKDPSKQWNDYSTFDFNTPSNRIICHVESDSMSWHAKLDRYYCRRSNDPPVSLQLDNVSIKEGLPPGTAVGTLNAFDAQRLQIIVYSVQSPNGKPLFRCQGAILKSSMVFKWDPTSQNSYSVLIRAQDNGSPRMWIEKRFNITVVNVNDPPKDIEISKNSVFENSTIGTVVGTLTAIDDDVSYGRSSNFFWKLLSNSSENFNISGANVVVSKSLNYHLKKVHYIRVSCDDSVNFSEKLLVIYVMNSIDPPTLTLIGGNIPENSKLGTVVGQIEAKSESNENLAFELTTSNAHVQAKFSLSPPPRCSHHQNATKFNTTCVINLTVSGHLDFEERSEYTVQVFVKNRESSNFKKWNITIMNVNEKPDKLDINGMMEIPETTRSGEDFCILRVSDPDNRNAMMQHHTCHVVNQDKDGQYFQVNHNTSALQVKANKSLNYEMQQSYLVTLTCSDDGDPPLNITRNVVINVTDTDEPIENLTLSNNEIQENARNGTLVGYLDAYDPDVHRPQSMIFSIVDSKDVPFRLEGVNNNKLVSNGSLNFEENSALVVTIRVTDSGGSHLQWPFRINIVDVNEPPTDIILSTNAMDENLVPGSFISNITMVDEDENTLTTCEILQDDHRMVSVNETLLIAGERPANHEMHQSNDLEILLRCCDQYNLCLEKNFTMEIRDVNEPPTDIIIDNLSVPENQKDIIVGNITVIDPDKDQKHFCTLLNGSWNSDEYLRIIRGHNTALYLIKELNFEKDWVKSFQISCREEGNFSTYSIMKQFDLNVIDVNEAPTKGCFAPLYVSPEQSLGTVLGSLNVTDPDNEIFTRTDDRCQNKQRLRYTMESQDDGLPFGVIEGYLVKIGETQATRTYNVTISVEDDGVVSSSSGYMTKNKMKVEFNCTVFSMALLKPLITLSSNRINRLSVNGTVIGYLNITRPADTNSSHYGDIEHHYQLVEDSCNSYPFVTDDNKLTITFYEQSRGGQGDESGIPNYVIVQVKSSTSSNMSTDVSTAGFVIVIEDDSEVSSWICFSKNEVLKNDALQAKLGPLKIHQEIGINKTGECREKEEIKDRYICETRPSYNDSSTDFGKLNLTNQLYVDPDMFLRINTSLDYENLKLEKLVVLVTCWNPRMPLYFVRGKLTVLVRDCERTEESGKKACVTCDNGPCKEGKCVDLKPSGYKCKSFEDTCEEESYPRNSTWCSTPSRCENSLCSHIADRCVEEDDNLIIGLSFLLNNTSYCRFEKCLGNVLGNPEDTCLNSFGEGTAGSHRQKRDTKKDFQVEILQVKVSVEEKKSLVYAAVWKPEGNIFRLQQKSSFIAMFKSTKDVVFLKPGTKDCAIFKSFHTVCPIEETDPTGKSGGQSGSGPFDTLKLQAAVGVGVAIILAVIVIGGIYCCRKRRNKRKEKNRSPSCVPVIGDFNNLAFDGTEMRNVVELQGMPKSEEHPMEKGISQNKNGGKKDKDNYDFNNPVYQEPNELGSIVKDRNNQSAEYAEPQAQHKHSFKGPKAVSNPNYAANDRILVQIPHETDEKNQSRTIRGEMLNPREKCQQKDPQNNYPYYEELPPLEESKKHRKLFLGRSKNNAANNVVKSGQNQTSTHDNENTCKKQDPSPYYHVLEGMETKDSQGSQSTSDDKNEKNRTSTPLYFVLEESAPTEKLYQSLHRELEGPPPEYERYRMPEKSGAGKNDQAAKERVYEEPF